MGFRLNFQTGKIIATFSNTIEGTEIKDVFLEIFDTIYIKELKLLLFDFTAIESYVIPKDYMKTLKTITTFSSAWNTNVKVIAIATNPEIRTAVTGIIKNQKDYSWEYLLYTDIETARKFNSEI